MCSWAGPRSPRSPTGVTLVLDSDDILADFGETRDSVLRRRVFDPAGHAGGNAEQAAGFPTPPHGSSARADVTA
ncbi:hypothetical protein [Nocardia nova]|uniref:hypothetical protein n=1 Tax=Nocardia nova TaxID=37330 RepID=UPI0011B0DE1E|nr:hypothetical protein [Nocardia nova]